MRLHAALLLIGFLAFAALPTDAAGRYNVLGIGADTCEVGASESGAGGAAPYRVWFAALVRVTCSLDSALLRIEQYSRAEDRDAGGEFAERVMAGARQKARAGR